ncbi:MAG: 4Fe-4S binding protein [Chitinispirillales bacterium]|jgi:Pyruvate/2-oxoacid:ferredoxin oxidoreductase delta subunit|nr:4Fe-4S binding protein [Chitinispirillales bacterium]
MAIKVDQEKCVGCGICIKACPEPNVIRRGENKKVSINTMFCKMCLLCASVCGKKAIEED